MKNGISPRMSLRLTNRPARMARRAQGIVEYSIITAAIIFGLVAMSMYMKRGLLGRYAEVVDTTVESANVTEYEPYYQDNQNIIEAKTKVKQDVKLKGELTRDLSQEYNYTIKSYGIVPEGASGASADETSGSALSGLFSESQVWESGRDPSQAMDILSYYSFEPADGYTLEDVQSKFLEFYNGNLGQRYPDTVNAVAVCVQELAKLNYIILYDNRS